LPFCLPRLCTHVDARALKTAGDPFPVAEQVDYLPGSIQGQFSVSQTGVLAFNSGGGSLKSQITWFDRGGRAIGAVGPPSVMQAPAISPDGTTVVVDRLDEASGTYALWLYDLVHQTGSRFTFDPSNHMFPLWSPDGSSILFASNRTGKFGLYEKAASGAEQEKLLFEADGETLPTDWSPRFVLLSHVAVKTGIDLWSLPMAGNAKAAPVLRTRFAENHGKLSPDGRWLAYDSDESGQPEVYVQTFPGAEGKWQVSTKGGARPVWSRSGRELFYISADNNLTAVDVESGARFEHGVPRPLFDVHMPPTATYDVSRDGTRFLILKGIDPEVAAPMTVVVNSLRRE
jgi:Tol biopolymer transport system component